VEIDVKRKLSEDQCSGSIFSDVSLDKSAYEEANERQLTVIPVSKQSGQVCRSSHVYLLLSEMAVESALLASCLHSYLYITILDLFATFPNRLKPQHIVTQLRM